MATLPPPMTTALPLRFGPRPSLTSRRKSSPSRTGAADAQEHDLKTLLLETLQGEVAAEHLARADLEPGGHDVGDVALERLVGEPIAGHAQQHGPAQLLVGLEERDGITAERQLAGSGQSARPTAHDRHTGFVRIDLTFWRRGHFFSFRSLLRHPIGRKPLEMIDRHRLVQFPAIALRLAGMMADPSAGGGERVPLADQLIGLRKAAVANQGRITLAVDLRRAGQHAGRALAFADGHCARNRLGITLEDRLPGHGAFVELAGHLDRAFLQAITTAIALLQIDEAWPLPHLDAEVSRFSFQPHHVGVGDQVDV